MKEQPDCNFHTDCFARAGGVCLCLTDNEFKDGCPFYKSKGYITMQKIEEEIKEYSCSLEISRAMP